MRLWHREQWQLKVYFASISDLLSTPTPKGVDSYSVEVLYQHSLAPMESLAISVKTHASTSCDHSTNVELDSRGLRQRIRTISLRNSTDQIRQDVKLVPHLVLAGNLDRAFYHTLSRCDKLEVRYLLKRGADLKAMPQFETLRV